MVKCDFCKSDMEPGTGKMLVMKDTKVFYFCSNKCEKNMMRMNRKPRETRWTGEFSHVKKKNTQK